MTTIDFVTALFDDVDEPMRAIPHHPEAHLWPSAVVTLGLLPALKGVGNRCHPQKICLLCMWPRPFFARWRLQWTEKPPMNRCRPYPQTRQLSIDKPGIRRKWFTFSVTMTRL